MFIMCIIFEVFCKYLRDELIGYISNFFGLCLYLMQFGECCDKQGARTNNENCY